MPRAKRSVQKEITIDGHHLIWHLHREQQMETDDGQRGVCIHVRRAEGVRRELHMEYPVVATVRNGYLRKEPAKPTIVTTKVEANIREAIEAGWDPDSRGKPYVFHLEELPN